MARPIAAVQRTCAERRVRMRGGGQDDGGAARQHSPQRVVTVDQMVFQRVGNVQQQDADQPLDKDLVPSGEDARPRLTGRHKRQ